MGRIRVFSIIIAVAVMVGLTTPALATFGYVTDPNNPQPATQAQVTTAVTTAIAQAAATGGFAAPTLVNVSTVSAAAVQNVFAQAAAANVATVLQLDSVQGNTILSRIYIDAATASQLSGNVDLSVQTSGAAVASAVNTFERFFNNNVAAVSVGQPGASFGTDIRMAVRADLSKLNTQSLTFYVHNSATNSFVRITPSYRIDAFGFLHFSTPVGGNIIITDRPLTRR